MKPWLSMAILEPSGANERVCSDVANITYLGLTRGLPARSLQGWIVVSAGIAFERVVIDLGGNSKDFDGNDVGKFVTEELSASTTPGPTIKWSVLDAREFPNGPADLVQAVLNEGCWVAVGSEYPNASVFNFLG
jgi:hypothetical protein